MSEFSADIDQRPQGAIVHLRGDASVTHGQRIRRAMDPLLSRPPRRVVVNMADLQFINSECLGTLVELRAELTAAGCDVQLAGAHDQIADVLKKTRLADLFPTHKDPEQALRESG